MKKILFSLMLMACTISVSARVPEIAEKESAIYTMNYFAENAAPKPNEMVTYAVFNNVYNSHDKMVDGVKSMIIHIDANIHNAIGDECSIIAYFYYENGDMLMDNNGRYKANGGQCCVSKIVTPKYKNTYYENFKLTIPYNEMEFDGTTAKLKYKLRVYDRTMGEFIDEQPVWKHITIHH